jgi:hypothetical protein
MIFSCVVPFKRKNKKIPDLSLPPCIPHSNLSFSICYVLVWEATITGAPRLFSSTSKQSIRARRG